MLDSPKKQAALPKVMSEADTGRLLDRAALEAQDPALTDAARHAALRLHALVETLYATGLRVSELVSLPVTVALRDERFFVVRGKGAKDRMVPLSGKARDAMRLWLAERSSRPALAESPWLFPAASDTGYLPRQVFARDLKGLGGPHRHFVGQNIAACPASRLRQPPAAERRRLARCTAIARSC